MKTHRSLAWLLVLTASASVSAADEFPRQKDYDGDGDGKLTPDEAAVFALHARNNAFFKLDKNKNGTIEQEEALEFANTANSEAKDQMALNRMLAENNATVYGGDPSQPLPYDDVADNYTAHPPPEKYKPGPFRMRGRVSDFPLKPKDLSVANVNPAVFSWSRDIIKDGDTWAARGAVGAYFESLNPQIALSLGADFDRVESDTGTDADVDTLVFRAMGNSIPVWGKNVPGADALAIRYGADYGTNFDFEGGTLGAAFELEPIWSWRPFKGIHSLFGVEEGRSRLTSTAISLRTYFRMEGGTTVDDFQAGTGRNGDYLRAGGFAEASLWPFGTDRPLSLTGTYGYLAALAGHGEDYHTFKAGAEWRLDKEGHFSLRLEYVDGLTPLLLQEQENLLLSLSVRF